MIEGPGCTLENIQTVTNYNGAWLGLQARVANCQAIANLNMGLRASAGSQVSGCMASLNGSHQNAENISARICNGMVTQWNDSFRGAINLEGYNNVSDIIGCTALSNTTDGIYAVRASVVDCTARKNYTGIDAVYSTVTGCTAFDNDRHGMHVSESHVYRNLSSDNGSDFNGAPSAPVRGVDRGDVRPHGKGPPLTRRKCRKRPILVKNDENLPFFLEIKPHFPVPKKSHPRLSAPIRLPFSGVTSPWLYKELWCCRGGLFLHISIHAGQGQEPDAGDLLVLCPRILHVANRVPLPASYQGADVGFRVLVAIARPGN
ncbi:MAG: right-handed parallel beta-helix repeat-containing protein [Spartobacteria bacterium]|nr:right-handed parallel beta-helix repeat-containing protein [Spartobacteria bacterium]